MCARRVLRRKVRKCTELLRARVVTAPLTETTAMLQQVSNCDRAWRERTLQGEIAKVRFDRSVELQSSLALELGDGSCCERLRDGANEERCVTVDWLSIDGNRAKAGCKQHGVACCDAHRHTRQAKGRTSS